MTRDDFEEWISVVHEEALDALPSGHQSLAGWLKSYGGTLKRLAAEEQKSSAEPAAEIDEDDDEDLDLDDDGEAAGDDE